ncbi:MAG: hypothetical protein AAGF11_54925 [Myxococcota bacterium]
MTKPKTSWASKTTELWSAIAVAALLGGCFNADGPSLSEASGSSDGTSTPTTGTSMGSSPSTTRGDPSGDPSGDPTGTSAGTPDSSSTSVLDGATRTSTTDGNTSSDGGATTGPVACNPLLDECGANEFCDAADCDTTGVCTERPASTDVAYAPACGCNGVSYWNVQHANWLGVTAQAAANGCAELNCFNDGDCPAGTQCTIDYGPGPGGCGGAVEGQCYGIPAAASCEGVLDGAVGFGSCASGPNNCNQNALNLCEALLETEFFVICL